MFSSVAKSNKTLIFHLGLMKKVYLKTVFITSKTWEVVIVLSTCQNHRVLRNKEWTSNSEIVQGVEANITLASLKSTQMRGRR